MEEQNEIATEFIIERDGENGARFAPRERTGWETVVFELQDDDLLEGR